MAPEGSSRPRQASAPSRRYRTLCILLSSTMLLGGCLNTLDEPDLLTTNTVTPRLQSNEPERTGPVINAAAFNADQISGTVKPFAGFLGTARINFAGDAKATLSDTREVARLSGGSFDPNEMVTVDFRGATIAFVLRQLLGGALAVNYVAPDDLGGRIDFRTEQPIPKNRVLQVVRDLLARNNLVIKLINGVYHVDRPEAIQALEANAAAGQGGSESTTVLKLDRGNAAQVIPLAQQLLPADVQVLGSGSPNTIIIKADPNDIEATEMLLKTLSTTAVNSEEVAIIPLSQSAPEAVALALTEFYQGTLRGEQDPVTIIPLQSQQAILVGTSDPSLMAGVRQLTNQLDRSVTDVSSLRVIPLTHIQANDIVPQLTQIFGNTANVTPEAREERLGGVQGEPRGGVRGSDTTTRLVPRPVRTQANVEDNDEGTGLAVGGLTVQPTIQLAEGANGRTGAGQAAATGGAVGSQGGGASAAQQGGGNVSRPGGVVQKAASPGETRVVADTRSNAILVYSTFSVYKRMREVVQTLDVAQAQVVIEATVVEVNLNDTLEQGVQFFLQSNGIVVGSGNPSGNQTPRRGGIIGIGTSIGNVSVDAVLNALNAVTNLKVVSSPYLTVLDNKSARLVIGDQIPFASRTQSSNNLGNTTVTQEVEILDTGVVLEITPRIHANNSVDLQINQSVSTPSQTAEAGDLTPVIATRNIQSQILVQSGRTILLGGLIQDRVEKAEESVPKVSRIPVIGDLFKQKTSAAQRTELLVMITPRVVRTSSEIENLTRLIQASQIGGQAVDTGLPPGAVAKP